MKLSAKTTSLALLTTFASSVISPMALADGSTQKTKNDWRNLATGAGAIAAYGLLKGDSAATLLGAAGAGYSAYRYEQERKAQDAQKRAAQRHSYYHRSTTQNGRKYYRYNGSLYYLDEATGERYPANP